MAWRGGQSFRAGRVHHRSDNTGITVPLLLKKGDQEVKLLATVDTEAAYCIFNRAYGEELVYRFINGSTTIDLLHDGLN